MQSHTRWLLEGIRLDRDPNEIAVPFAENLGFKTQGDIGVMPWIGRKTGHKAMTNSMRDLRAMTEPLAFHVEDVLASEERAVIVGVPRTRIKATGLCCKAHRVGRTTPFPIPVSRGPNVLRGVNVNCSTR